MKTERSSLDHRLDGQLQQHKRQALPGLVLLGSPTVLAVAADIAIRGYHALPESATELICYALGIFQGLGLWAALLYCAARSSGLWPRAFAAIFVATYAFALGGQQFFYQQYNAYLTPSAVLFATGFWANIGNQLAAEGESYARTLSPYLLSSLLLVICARRWVRPTPQRSRFAAWLVPVLLAEAVLIQRPRWAVQAGPPDMLFLSALGGLFHPREGSARERHALPVALETPVTAGAARPNVVLILLESVRADAVCNAYDPGCTSTPYSNAAVPGRHALMQLRALDSSTAISMAVLSAGVAPSASEEIMYSWPLLFDYANASGYTTAYWTSQSILLDTTRMWTKNLGVDHIVQGEQLDAHANIDLGASDALLADYVAEHVSALREPYFAVVHLSNTHGPYKVDEQGPLLVPIQATASSEAKRLARYTNAVHQNDQQVAKIIRSFREHPTSSRTVVIATSDHGEALGERNVWGHVLTLFDHEIHVPGWIDAPDGTLTATQLEQLQHNRDAYVTHADLAATILDLIGVWDDPGIARYRTQMPGQSLLQPRVAPPPLPMTNCAAVWSCAFRSWGYIQGSYKLFATELEHRWNCYDLAHDPHEQRPLHDEECKRLETLATRLYGGLPSSRALTERRYARRALSVASPEAMW